MTPVVMLHGWGINASVFDTLARDLSSRGALSAPDLPGYGAAAPCEPHTLDTLAERVSAGAPPRCHVVGWSLGAQVALTWARLKPRQVERLALIAATPCFVQREDWRSAMEKAVFDTFAESLVTDRSGALARFAALQAFGDDRARRTTQYLRAALTARAVPAADVLEGGLRILRESDLRARLGELGNEVLLVHGERDALVPCAAAEYLAHALPRATLEVIPGAAHAPFVSSPAAVSALVRAFFE